MDELRLALQRLRYFHHEDGSISNLSFVPEPNLFDLFTRDVVEKALEDSAFELEPHQRSHMAAEIIDGARKVFSILIELRMEKKLRLCLERGVVDSTLPILGERRLRDLFPESATLFEKLQWEYLPLRFREHSHKDLEPSRVLPFVNNEKLSSGGFSTVFKVSVHPAYHNWKSATNLSQHVRKEISSSTSYEAQRRESDLLFLLRSMENDNIVQLVTSYTQNGLYNLLFPVADYDLHGLLLNEDQPDWCRSFKQVFDSFRGLANGLYYLHNFRPLAKSTEEMERITKHGYHHDIKPRNILLRGSRLILADFGLARLKDATEDSQTQWKNTPPTYGAPEARDPVTLEARHIGRAYDTWSIGCVLGEFATYCIAGAEAVRTFRRERIRDGRYGTHNCFHHDGDVNPAVSDWYREMTDRHPNSPKCSLLTLSREFLVVDPKERPTSEYLIQELNKASLSQYLKSILHLTCTGEIASSAGGLSPVYQSKLALERNRMHAWGYAFGLESFAQHMHPWVTQTSKNYDQIHTLLKTCNTKVASMILQHYNVLDIQQQVLDTITSTNNALVFGVSQSAMNTIENTFKLMTVSTSNTVKLLVHAIDKRSTTLAATEIQAEWNPHTSQDQEAGQLAAARYMSLLLATPDSLISTGTIKLIDPAFLSDAIAQCTRLTPLAARWYYQGFRDSDKQKVLVEERSYDGPWTRIPDEDRFADIGREVSDRVQELAHLFQMHPKPKDMRILDSFGTYHIPSLKTFGFVYKFPQDQSDFEPISLATLIRETKEPERNPTLNDKFTLANVITACVYTLHMTGWIHKAICSSNIIFFRDLNLDMTKVELGLPYLAGFQHSRQSKPGAYSDSSISIQEKAFIHPNYLIEGTGYHSTFDYYALGVVLFEISIWRTVDKLFKTETAAEDLRRLLLQYAKRYIPQRMGTGYYEVVVACLGFHEKYGDEKSVPGILLRFQEEVLEKLQQGSLPQ